MIVLTSTQNKTATDFIVIPWCERFRKTSVGTPGDETRKVGRRSSTVGRDGPMDIFNVY